MRHFRRDDPFGFWLGLLFAAAAAVGLFYTGRDYYHFGSAPRRVGLDEAARISGGSRRWVALEHALWQCEQIQHPDGFTYLPARSSDGVLVIARWDRMVTCDEARLAPLTGIIEPMSGGQLDELQANGLPGSERSARELDVCAFCGRDNSRLGVLMCFAGLLFGLFLVPIRGGWASLRGRYVDWVQGYADMARAGGKGDPAQVRKARLILAAVLCGGGVILLPMKDWVIDGILPVPWLGFGAIGLGLLMLALALTR